MAIFPGEPELISFTEAKDDGSGGDNWNNKSWKARQIVTTNKTSKFYRPAALCPSCHQTNSVKELRNQISQPVLADNNL